jgi:hypothetical protein
LTGLLSAGAAQAQEAEDSSAEFKADMEELEAMLGVPATEASVTTHSNGMKSANLGLSAMKMLVVRQNEDGSISYGHAASAEDAEAFLDADHDHDHGAAEE